MKRVIPTLLAAAALLSGGCSDSLDPASLLNKTRPLGVRFSVQGDPDRAEPAIGETVDVTLLIGHEAEEVEVNYVAVFCVAEATTIGPPQCLIEEIAGEQVPALVGFPAIGTVTGDPQFALPIPTELDGTGVTSLLGFAAFCAGPLSNVLEAFDGVFEGGTSVSACANPEDDGALLTVTLPLADGVDDNNNPGIASLTFGGTDWTEVPLGTDPIDGCSGDSMIEVPAGSQPLTILMRPEAMSREVFTNEDDEQEQEELQVTILATDGEMERTFSFIDDNRDVVEVEWLPPEEARMGGTRVRFEFVMRDLRGGIDRVRRQICVF